MAISTNNILGTQKYKTSRKPILTRYYEQISNIDPEFQKLRHVMIRPTKDNREYGFWVSSVAQSFTYMTIAALIGDGLRVRSPNMQAKKIVQGWLQEINVNRKTIEDYYASSWIDEITHCNSYWRNDINHDYTYNVDIQRLDPKTITKYRDPKYSWTLIFQDAPNYKSYRSKAAFYAKAKESDNAGIGYWNRTKKIRIPDEPQNILRTHFFDRPPISSALHYIAYKRAIMYFMRKYSQKYWSPFLLFYVGDPKSNFYPADEDEMQERINDIADVVPDISNFGSAVFSGDVKVDELGKSSGKNSELFIKYADFLDKQTMMAIFGSMGLRDSSGNELATQRGIREGWLQFINGIRRKYKISLEHFCVKCLLPANGIKVSEEDLDLEYSPLSKDASIETMQAVEIATRVGAFKDRNEIRKASQVVWNWMEALQESENKKVEFDPLGLKANSTADAINEYMRR
jgi:hypothetical protein